MQQASKVKLLRFVCPTAITTSDDQSSAQDFNQTTRFAILWAMTVARELQGTNTLPWLQNVLSSPWQVSDVNHLMFYCTPVAEEGLSKERDDRGLQKGYMHDFCLLQDL